MVVINTMEALEAVASGEAIRVAGPSAPARTWVRSQNGFDFDGVTVPVALFESHIKAGQVSDMRTPEPGEFFTRLAYGLGILTIEGDQVHAVRFYSDRFREIQTVSVNTIVSDWVRAETVPAYWQVAQAMGALIRSYLEQHALMQRALDQANEDLRRERELLANLKFAYGTIQRTLGSE